MHCNCRELCYFRCLFLPYCQAWAHNKRLILPVRYMQLGRDCHNSFFELVILQRCRLFHPYTHGQVCPIKNFSPHCDRIANPCVYHVAANKKLTVCLYQYHWLIDNHVDNQCRKGIPPNEHRSIRFCFLLKLLQGDWFCFVKWSS